MNNKWIVLVIFTLVATLFSAPTAVQAAHTSQIVAPSTVVYGHQPIDIEVILVNPSNKSASDFTAKIWLGGPAWGGENYPYNFTDGTQITGLVCGGWSCVYDWSGTIPARGEVKFTMRTFSGNSLGSYELVRASYTIQSQTNNLSKSVTLTQGNEPPLGIIDLQGDHKWKPGELRGLQLAMYAPNVGQFIGGVFTSDCGIQGLPSGFVGSPNRTYQEFLWYVYLPVDSPVGNCTIRGTFHQFGKTEEYAVTYKFHITK